MVQELKKIFFAVVLSVAVIPGFCQKVYQDNTVRFALWAELEAYPGLFDSDKGDTSFTEEDKKWLFPVARMKKTAPFIIEGMVYGWNFSYTPYDKTRGVSEYFEFTPIHEFTEEEKAGIHYRKPWIEDSKLFAWVEYDRTESQRYNLSVWNSVTNPKIRGLGYAKLTEGFDGIQKASGEAMKNAVREHMRKLIKNKPKEITGRLLICESPSIGIDSGRYVVTLDFFIESTKIIKYQTF